jgi:D-methionine transport system substrate-binding protein
VTTPKLQNDPRIAQLAKDLTSPQVARYITDHFAGSVIPVAGSQP